MLVPLTLLWATSLARAFPLDARQASGSDGGGDPCAALATNDTFYLPSQVKACLQTVPFRTDVRDNIMAALTAYNTLNIFQYNQLGNDNPVLNQGVDLNKEFERINSTDYSSDFEFQSDLTAVVNSLHDGHYYWQNCYANVLSTSSYMPIVALQKEDEGGDGQGETAIYLAPNLPLFAAQNGLDGLFAQAGYNLSDLAGAEVTAIEGQSPWDYLDQVAGLASGNYQDSEQRLNFQFASLTAYYGGVGINAGRFTQTSSFDKDNITLSIKTSDGQEMDVASPWFTSYGGKGGWTFQSGEEFFNATCLFQATESGGSASGGGGSSNGTETGNSTETTGPPMQESNSTSSSTPDDGPVDVDSLIQAAYAGCPIEFNAPKYTFPNAPQNSNAYLGGRDIQFYALGDDKKTGVIFVPTFGPMDISTNAASAQCTNRFVADLYTGFKNFTAAGVEKILIDTSNNGGGAVALNQFFQRYITGEKYEVDLNFDTLLRDSPLARGLLQANIQNASNDTEDNIYNPSKYRNGTEEIALDTDLFNPGNEYTINGQTLKTSNAVSDSIQQIDDFEGPLNISDTPPYSPAEIVFTGNGLCGSACSSFTNFLIEYYNATAYINAGRPQNPIEFQAFAAGQAVTSQAIQEEAVSVNYTDYSALPPLQVIGTFGFAVRGALSPNIAPGTFLQYRSYPAQNRYGLTAEQFLDPLANWKYVASKVFA